MDDLDALALYLTEEIKKSNVAIVINPGDGPFAGQQALSLGIAVLLGKRLFLIEPKGRPVNMVLRRLADDIAFDVDITDAGAVTKAIEKVKTMVRYRAHEG